LLAPAGARTPPRQPPGRRRYSGRQERMNGRTLRLSWVCGKFAVCRLAADAPIPKWAWSAPFSSVTRTADELSIVCAVDGVPEEHRPSIPWVCLKLEGPFPFSEIGILASVLSPLAEKGVSIVAISTFDTDYVLVGEDRAAAAVQALRGAGHELVP
jgi:uncharacterized protein